MSGAGREMEGTVGEGLVKGAVVDVDGVGRVGADADMMGPVVVVGEEVEGEITVGVAEGKPDAGAETLVAEVATEGGVQPLNSMTAERAVNKPQTKRCLMRKPP
jgi:hypothetical protein